MSAREFGATLLIMGKSSRRTRGTPRVQSGEPAAWGAPNPRDLPSWRRDMLTARRSDGAALEHALVLGAAGQTPHIIVKDPAASAVVLNRQEAKRLEDAELFYATQEAARLSISVVDEIADDVLTERDPPSPAGLIVFAEPIATWVSKDRASAQEPVRVVAASWGPHTGATHQIPRSLSGIWFTLYSPTVLSPAEYARETGLDPDPVRLRAATRALYRTNGPLIWDNEIFIPFGADPQRLSVLDAYGWSLVVRAAWMLMDSPGITQTDEVAASKTELRRERNARAAEARPQIAGPPAVRVVDLRRRQTQGAVRREEHAGQDGRRVYTCRWTVKGHTRRQRHGPGNTLTKRIYIEPHLQGPHDAPIKISVPETVRLFDV